MGVDGFDAFVLSPNGENVVLRFGDQRAVLRELRSGAEVQLPSDFADVAWSRDSKWAALGGREQLVILSTESGAVDEFPLPVTAGHVWAVPMWERGSGSLLVSVREVFGVGVCD
jgi:hypothetical protein